jgi:STE24 endopeptidase
VTEDKATRYHRLKRRSEVASLLWSAVCFSGLLLAGISKVLADMANGLTGGSLLLAVPLMVLGLSLVHELGALPLAWLGGHRLERRYGLSHQTLAGWLGDHFKAAGLGVVLACGGALVVYLSMRWFPGAWWLTAGVTLAMVVIGLATVAPVLLLPLFFRFTPLARPSLVERLERLASRAGTSVVGVYEWALADKSRRANAALTGLGATRRILVSDTMLADYSDEEIEVVLAHELGHHVHYDIWRGIALESALTLLGFALTDVVLRSIGPRLGVSSPADLAGMPLLVLTAGAVSLVLTPAALALSRRHERRADRFALQLTSNPSAFISAMRRLGAQNLGEERPSRLVRWLFHSHPPLDERLAFARAWPNDVRQPQSHRGH